MAYIPEDIIAQVLDRTDIVEIIGSYIPLKPAGRNFKALSPFASEKTPSFVVSPEKQIFHCFSTGKGGNVLTFLMMQERMTFPEAVRFLAQKVGIEISEENNEFQVQRQRIKDVLLNINRHAVDFFHQQLIVSKTDAANQARDYLKRRGTTLEMVKSFQIGFALDEWDALLESLIQKKINIKDIEKAGLVIARKDRSGFYDRFRNRIVFPIFDYRGEPVAFGARSLNSEESAKYINSPETPLYIKGRHLYGFQLSKESVGKDDHVLVVEGYMDFIMPYQAGIRYCVASLDTALTVDQIRLIRRYTKNITMLYDTDKAGQNAMLRSVDLLIEEGMNVKIAQLSDGEDPDSFIRSYGVNAFKEKINKAQTIFDFKLQALIKEYDQTTVEGRAKICDNMLVTLQKYDNEVIKSEYTRRLSRSLGISEHALMAQSRQKAPYKMKEEVVVMQEKKVSEELRRSPEWQLLSVVFQHHELLVDLKNNIELDDIDNAPLKEIYSGLFQQFELGHRADTAQLLQQIDDQSIQSLLTEVISQDQIDQRQSNKIFVDCVSRIKQKRYRLKRQNLLMQIRQAEQQGDDQIVQQLQEEFKKLVAR